MATDRPTGDPAKGQIVRLLFENSIFLIGGAVAALFWANHTESYHQLLHTSLLSELCRALHLDLQLSAQSGWVAAAHPHL